MNGELSIVRLAFPLFLTTPCKQIPEPKDEERDAGIEGP